MDGLLGVTGMIIDVIVDHSFIPSLSTSKIFSISG
jgi:hypothetical protein